MPPKKKYVQKKCPHGKQKRNCRDCGGSNICEHNIQKQTCRDCNGKAFCEHDRQRHTCKDCKGSSVCEHGRIVSQCKDCSGAGICEHGKRRTLCAKCEGGSICEHGIGRRDCKDCDGRALCIHKTHKTHCIECNGSSICEHKVQRYYCLLCKGKGICEHGIRKQSCIQCKGSQICVHDKRKCYCKTCDGSLLCNSPHCETLANKKYQGYCFRCFLYLFPDNEIIRNHKTKERAVADYIREQFPNYTITLDKPVAGGCSKRRPDVLIDFGEYTLIIEIDENQHDNYDCTCENKRLMELFQDAGSRPLVMIRFNPDEYTNHKNEKVTSCWGYTKEKGLCAIKKTKQKEWQKRLESLSDAIKLQINYTGVRKEIDVVHLYYDGWMS